MKLYLKNVELCSIINRKSWELNLWRLLINVLIILLFCQNFVLLNYGQFYVNLLFDRSIYRPKCTHMVSGNFFTNQIYRSWSYFITCISIIKLYRNSRKPSHNATNSIAWHHQWKFHYKSWLMPHTAYPSTWSWLLSEWKNEMQSISTQYLANGNVT